MSLLLLFGGVSGPATQTLTQDSRFDNSNSLAYAHTLAPGTVTLTQSATFTNTNALAFTHTLTPGAVTLTQSATFTNTNALAFTHQVDLRLTQAATIQNDQSFYAHARVADQTLTQAAT